MRRARVLGAAIGALLVAQIGVVAARDGGTAPPAPAAPAAAAPVALPTLPVPAPAALTVPPVGIEVEVTPGPEPGVAASVAVDVPSLAPSTGARCGAEDRPETGIQGDVPLADQLSGRAAEGYNCGLALVGHTSLGGRGSNANLAWAGHCAYVAGDGIAVVDVSDPTAPEQVGLLTTAGSTDTLETLHAVDAADRSILVAGRYGLFVDFVQPGGPVPVDVYDVSDCERPRLLSTILAPTAVHNLTLSADARTLWSTLPLQAFDLTDPTAPVHLGSMEQALRDQGLVGLQWAHEAWPSPDGTRLYIGSQVPLDESTMILDIEGWPARPPRVVSRFSGPGHSIRPATIGGREYLLRSDESVLNPTAVGCAPDLTPFGGAAQAFLTDISDEAAPVDRGRLTLDVNDPLHCVDQVLSGVNASSHYHDVDDAADTTFAMVSMWNAGLRLFDVRDPSAPVEVAYFNPGAYASSGGGATPFDQVLGLLSFRGLDQAWGHVRYLPETGHVWMATSSGGFWVLELEPQVRAALGLDARPAVHPRGAPPRPASTRVAVAPRLLDDGALYCTLGRF